MEPLSQGGLCKHLPYSGGTQLTEQSPMWLTEATRGLKPTLPPRCGSFSPSMADCACCSPGPTAGSQTHLHKCTWPTLLSESVLSYPKAQHSQNSGSSQREPETLRTTPSLRSGEHGGPGRSCDQDHMATKGQNPTLGFL